MLPQLAARLLRVNVRVQPYTPEAFRDVRAVLPHYAAAGVHGIIVEGLKRKTSAAGLVQVAADWCYPVEVLAHDFERIRDRCHALGLAFYCAENRLRLLSDDRCCCGVDGLSGFRPNRANLNAIVFGRPIQYTARQRAPGTAAVFKSLCQDAVSTPALRALSYADAMELVARVPVYRRAMGLLPLRGALPPV